MCIRDRYIADLKKKHGSVELISSGSSIKICLVAEGSADAVSYTHLDVYKRQVYFHDTAAFRIFAGSGEVERTAFCFVQYVAAVSYTHLLYKAAPRLEPSLSILSVFSI